MASSMVPIKENPRYYVTEEGQVWDSKREIFLPQYRRSKKSKYICVTISIEGKFKLRNVHRLVAQAFIPNPNNYPQVNHKDEDPSNNNVSNLEWCDAQYNNAYGNRNKRCSLMQLNRADCSKPVLQYDKEGNFIKKYPSAQEAQRQTGVTRSCICRVCNNAPMYYTAGGYVWKWAEVS